MEQVSHFNRFRELPLTAIRPQGFLREFLLRQEQGLSGHYAEQGYPYNTVMWRGTIAVHLLTREYHPAEIKVPDTWWPYEQCAYLLDGLERLGLLLDNRQMTNVFAENLAFLRKHLSTAGLMEAYRMDSLWPLTVFFRGVEAYAAAAPEEARQVYRDFAAYYQSLSVDELAGKFRNVTAIEALSVLFFQCREPRFRELATAAWTEHEQRNRRRDIYEEELFEEKCKAGARLAMHGVTFCEELKLPVILFDMTGEKHYLESAEAILQGVLRDHEQPGGMISANEFLSGRDPLQGYEICVISDFLWTLGYFLMARGKAEYADRMERIAYNALPGAVTRDFSAVQYISGVNQIVSTPFANHTHHYRGRSPWRQYRPNHAPECCAGNIHRAMPNFVARMWLADANGAPVAALYGPSEIHWHYNGKTVDIQEQTEYPFAETITFEFKVDGTLQMPFSFRIPAWCAQASVKLNGRPHPMELAAGKFVTITSEWRAGDRLELTLPMAVKQCRDRQWTWVERGPLLYAYLPPAHTSRDGQGAIAEYRFEPAADWNYALPENLEKTCRVLTCNSSGYPFAQPPVALEVDAHRISNYSDLALARFTPPIPLFYRVSGTTEKLRLVPVGAGELRLAAFPDARERRLVPVMTCVAAPQCYPYNFRLPLSEQCFEGELYFDRAMVDFCGNNYLPPDETEYFDLIRCYHEDSNVLTYMQFDIWADEAGPATLVLNAAHCAEGWFNGRKILSLNGIYEAEMSAGEWFPISLRRGHNYFKLKIAARVRPSQYRIAWGARCTVFQ